jgi:hypothetical protein
LFSREVIPSLINIKNCPSGSERKERRAMYAKTGRENVPVQMEKMMHTHHVMQREQSNGLIGFRSFAFMSLVRADLHASVNPDKSTIKIVMAAMSSRSM